jgi:TRAP-type mannitol/chloroaromatic compound transport system permease small subunit
MRPFVRPFLAFCDALHRLTLAVAAGLLIVSVTAQFAGVLLRYGAGTGRIWLSDLGLWSFAAAAALSLPAAIALDANVRAGLRGGGQETKGQGRAESAAIVLLLVPLFATLLALSLPEALDALRHRESSPQIGGLPGYWLVRLMLPASALLCLVQGAAMLLRGGGKANAG